MSASVLIGLAMVAFSALLLLSAIKIVPEYERGVAKVMDYMRATPQIAQTTLRGARPPEPAQEAAAIPGASAGPGPGAAHET